MTISVIPSFTIVQINILMLGSGKDFNEISQHNYDVSRLRLYKAKIKFGSN